MVEQYKDLLLLIEARLNQRKMIQKKNSGVNQEEMDEDTRKPKEITNSPENLVARSHMFVL